MSLVKLNTRSCGGIIGQIIEGTHTSQVETTSTSYVTSNIDVAITPSATSSKVYLCVNASAHARATTSAGGVNTGQFYRSIGGGSYTAIGDDFQLAVNRQDSSYTQESGGSGVGQFIDSPNTTSAITYVLYFKKAGGDGARVCNINQGASIIAMEVLV